jgi:hypothetical protein
MKECLWCDTDLKKGPQNGKKKYCDLSCWYSLLKAMRNSGEIWEEFAATLTCAKCGTEFKTVKGSHRDLCSDQCRDEKPRSFYEADIFTVSGFCIDTAWNVL